MSEVVNIKAEQLKDMLDSNDVVLLDVREKSEHLSTSIPGSKNVPLSEVTIDAAYCPLDKNKKLVIHCQTGRRSMMACEKLMSEGLDCEVFNLEGGIVAWEKAGFPVKKGERQVISLDRQLQIIMGLISLLGLIFGIFINHYWLIFSLIISLGLINAGITGWCGLAKLVAKMPWNTSI